jgi:hypothetical protein
MSKTEKSKKPIKEGLDESNQDLKQLILTNNAELREELNEIKQLIKDHKKALQGLVEIQKKLIHQGGLLPPPSNEYSEPAAVSTKDKTIKIINFGERIGVIGDTYKYNDAIKNAAEKNNEKAKWDPSSKTWHVSIDCLDALIQNLIELDLEEGKDFFNQVTKPKPASTSARSSSKKATKVDDDEGFGSGF